ncbi:MAG TPA: EamA family transporter [Candidatus Dormibacteraeota bacterium]
MTGVAFVLALGAAALYGSGDFCGGLATRRSTLLATIATSHVVGLVMAVLLLGLVPAPHVGAGDLAWGAAGGLVGAVGVALLYLGLARGTMSIVAPITASTAAALPVVIGLALGERPSALALSGVALAVGSVVLLGAERKPALRGGRPRADRVAILSALGAGAAFALLFTFWSRTSGDAGLWPLVAARIVSSGCALLIAAVTRRPALVAAPALTTALLAGFFDMGANVCYLIAVHHGLLSLVAVLTSLYPATTVLLATTLLGERMAQLQWVGLALALVAIALIVA